MSTLPVLQEEDLTKAIRSTMLRAIRKHGSRTQTQLRKEDLPARYNLSGVAITPQKIKTVLHRMSEEGLIRRGKKWEDDRAVRFILGSNSRSRRSPTIKREENAMSAQKYKSLEEVVRISYPDLVSEEGEIDVTAAFAKLKQGFDKVAPLEQEVEALKQQLSAAQEKFKKDFEGLKAKHDELVKKAEGSDELLKPIQEAAGKEDLKTFVPKLLARPVSIDPKVEAAAKNWGSLPEEIRGAKDPISYIKQCVKDAVAASEKKEENKKTATEQAAQKGKEFPWKTSIVGVVIIVLAGLCFWVVNSGKLNLVSSKQQETETRQDKPVNFDEFKVELRPEK